VNIHMRVPVNRAADAVLIITGPAKRADIVLLLKYVSLLLEAMQ